MDDLDELDEVGKLDQLCEFDVLGELDEFDEYYSNQSIGLFHRLRSIDTEWVTGHIVMSRTIYTCTL